MKKTPKRILGFLGLAVVAVMTVFAAIMPSPEVTATSSATESIVVRVLPSSPSVTIISPVSGSNFAKAEQIIKFEYSMIGDLLTTMEKDMSPATPQIYPIYGGNQSFVAGDKSFNIDFSEAQYGYGDYTLKVIGQGQGGLFDDDASTFHFYPVVATVEEDPATGKIYAVIEYDDKNTDIDYFTIDVYDEKNDLVIFFPRVEKGTKRVELPFAEKNLSEGRFSVSTTAFDFSNSKIYKSYDELFMYQPINVPNTGGLFAGLNISKSDYLITGLIVFFVAGLAGVVFITRGKSSRK